MSSIDRRRFLASTAAAAAGAVAGCADSDPVRELAAYRSYGYGPHNRGTTLGATGPAGGPAVAWRVEDAAFAQTPAVVDGRVFAATARRSGSVVVGLDAQSGEELWTYAGAALTRWRPAVADGTLYFVDSGGTGHAVATDDGSDVWQRSLPREQPAAGAPVVADGAVVFGLGDLDLFRFGGLYALETDDGSTRWHRGPGDGNSHTPAYPAVADGTVYYAAFPAGGRGEAAAVRAVSVADGDVERTVTVDGEAVYTGVAVTDDRVYAGGTQASLALDRGDWSVAWRSSEEYLFAPPTVGDRPYVGAVGKSGVGLRALGRDGEERWRHTRKGLVGTPGPATVADGVAYYGAGDGRLYALDADSGDRQWRVGERLTGFWAPAVLDGAVYVASGRGLVALR
jgi:outer membrane protein assembly factor BamB